jgi:hypothetical protein
MEGVERFIRYNIGRYSRDFKVKCHISVTRHEVKLSQGCLWRADTDKNTNLEINTTYRESIQHILGNIHHIREIIGLDQKIYNLFEKYTTCLKNTQLDLGNIRLFVEIYNLL